MDEKLLIKQILAGDMTSFSCLVSKYESMAYTLAFGILKNRQDAEEVTQDAFIKMYKALSSFQFNCKFSTWFYSIVYNTALSANRKNKPTSDDENILISQVDESTTAHKALALKERKEIINKIMLLLPAEEASLLTFFYLQQLSIEEIVDITKLTSANVRTKLHRSRQKFYTLLQKELKNEIRNLL